MEKYKILAFYCYTEIEDPKREAKRHFRFLEELDVKARIYVAQNGINAQMSIASEEVSRYIDWLKGDPRYAETQFKIDSYHEHVFPRLSVKAREQLVALDANPDLSKKGRHLSPEEWNEMLERNEEDTLLIDVRNDYESKIGHFEGAELPPLKTFREFPSYAEELSKKKDPKKTKVMMYCTGGIRCETYSALLKEQGFEEVYQLEGGVINYGHKMGGKHWRGKLFVFDDRLSVPISDEEPELISECHLCGISCDVYYNCANMDCNKLFLSCIACSEKRKGCCSEECTGAPRVRPFEKSERPKPFRRWYKYRKNKNCEEEYVAECGCTD